MIIFYFLSDCLAYQTNPDKVCSVYQEKKSTGIVPLHLGGRTLPHNLEAEEAVIGGILFSGKALHQVGELVRPEDFYHDHLRVIYETMIELDALFCPIDLITVADQLRKNGFMAKLKAHREELYLAQIASQISTIENITYHASIVRDKAITRKLIDASARVIDQGLSDPSDVNEYLDHSQQTIFEVVNRTNKQSYEPIRKILTATIQTLEQRYQKKELITGVPTGYKKFDELTTGLQAGELIIIAARPSMGKTAFALNCAQNAAALHKIPVLVFSLEMSKESLIERMLCSESKIDSQRLRGRGGPMEPKDWINLTKAASKIASAPLWIDDSGAPSLMEIRAKCRRWRGDSSIFPSGENKTGLVVIDYLQLIQARLQSKDSNREREISEISRGLKALAKELGLPVVALSQLNRSVESRADKRPMASDLRESGAIEQDADLICFIYRDEVYNKETKEQGVAEIIIGKQRNGPTDTVKLTFLNRYTRFENMAEGRSEYG